MASCFLHNNLVGMVMVLTVIRLAPAVESETDTLLIFESPDTIRVVADRFKLTLKELAHTYQIIDRQEIQLLSQHSALELVDLVNPSAFILEKNVMGYGVGVAGAGNINIRGLGGSPNTGLLVLVDGHPDFMGLFGHPLPDVYGVDEIAQVEILSGPASAMFGSQAMAGVVNIKSGPDFNVPINVSASAGSYASYNLGLNLNRRFNRHGFFLTMRQRATSGHIKKTSFRAFQLQTGWQYTISPVWQLSIQGRYVPYEFDDPTRDESNDKLGIYGKIRRGMAGITLKNDHTILRGSTQVFNNLGHHRFSDGFESHDFTWGASTYQQWQISSTLNLAGGGEFMRYGGKSNITNTLYQEDSFGIYFLGFYNLSALLNLKGGLRYQSSSLKYSSVIPVAGIGINILPTLQFYANYQRGFRYPTINELYLFPPSDPDLEVEKVSSIETGLWYYWQGKNYIRLTLYQNDASNLIQLTPNVTPPPMFRYANSGAAKQWGMETEMLYVISNWLTGQIGISRLDPDRLTAYNPETQFKYQVELQRGWFTVILYGKYVEKLYVANDHMAPLPDYHVLNLVLRGTFAGWSLNLHLLNVLDRHYLAFTNFPAPGFHFMAGLTYRVF